MAARRSYSERIADLKQKQAQLKEQERSLLARKVADEKRAQTKRHLQIGAAVEAFLGHPVSKEELENIFAMYALQTKRQTQDDSGQRHLNQNRFQP